MKRITHAPSVLSTGYVALDAIPTRHGVRLQAGGTAANVAAALSFLGWRSSVAASIGLDEAGALVLRDLRKAVVDTTLVRRSPRHATPLVLHEVARGNHSFAFGCDNCGRQGARFRPPAPSLAEAIIESACPRVFFFDRASPFSVTLASSFRSAGSLIIFEPSGTGSKELNRLAASLAHIVKYSAERAPAVRAILPRSLARQFRIETRGAKGCRIRFGMDRYWKVLPAYSVRAIDPGGSGDWMTAGLIHALSGKIPGSIAPVLGAAEFGQALGALNCLVPGARTISTVLNKQQLVEACAQLRRGGHSLAIREPGRVRRSRTARCVKCGLSSNVASQDWRLA